MKIGISQSIEFPTVYAQQVRLQRNNVSLSEKAYAVSQSELTRNVRLVYFKLYYETERLRLLKVEDSVYHNFLTAAELRFKTGETSYLENLSAKSRYQEIQLQMKQTESEEKSAMYELQKLLNTSEMLSVSTSQEIKVSGNIDSTGYSKSPIVEFYKQRINVAKAQLGVERNKLLPDFSARYFNQALYNDSQRYYGYSLGISIPIFFNAPHGKIQAAKIGTLISQAELENTQNGIRAEYKQLFQEYDKYLSLVKYYEDAGLKQADEILKIADKGYRAGEINYIEYTQGLSQASQMKRQYLEYKFELNQTIININYLLGE